jgi:magnesium-dependent phosphatase 1
MPSSWGEDFKFFDDVPGIVQELRRRGIRMSVASRTSAPDTARDMLRMLTLHPTGMQAIDFFEHPQMYPGTYPSCFRDCVDLCIPR